MVKLKIKQFTHDNVADAAAFSGNWDADKDYTIKWIWFKRKDGKGWTKSDCTVHVAKDPITLDKALLSTFGYDTQFGLPINEPLGAKERFEYTGTNREGATISLVVEVILEKTGA